MQSHLTDASAVSEVPALRALLREWALLEAGSEESIQFVRMAQAKLSLTQVVELAREVSYVRPLIPYPGWRFDADWNKPDLLYQMRRAIWERFHSEALGYEFVLDWHPETKLAVRMGNDLSKQTYVGGCNEPNEMCFLANALKPGMTFVDAGAMEGIYTVLAAHKVGADGHVYAFEPSGWERQSLERNIEVNGFGQVKVFESALSDADGEGMLRIADDEHCGQNTLGGFVFQGVRETGRMPVPLARLDTVAVAQGWTRLDYVKVDVEGAEMKLLQGAEETLDRFQPVIVFEAAEELLAKQGASVGQLMDWFSRRDYLLYRFGPEGMLEPAANGPADSMVASPRNRPLTEPGGTREAICDQ